MTSTPQGCRRICNIKIMPDVVFWHTLIKVKSLTTNNNYSFDKYVSSIECWSGNKSYNKLNKNRILFFRNMKYVRYIESLIKIYIYTCVTIDMIYHGNMN